MNAYEMFKTNDKLEVEEGITLDYGEFTIKVCRAGGANKKFSKVLGLKMKPHRRQAETDTLAEGVAERIMAEVYAETVILGWKGVKDEKGKDMEFNKQNVVKLFLDLPDLFRDVQEQANKIALFRAEEKEEDAKN